MAYSIVLDMCNQGEEAKQQEAAASKQASKAPAPTYRASASIFPRFHGQKSWQQLLCETVASGEAPYMQDFSEAEQRALNDTARKLQKYLLSTYNY